MALDLMGSLEVKGRLERAWAIVVISVVGLLCIAAWDPVSVDIDETAGVVVRELEQVTEFPRQHEAKVYLRLSDGSNIITFLPLSSCRLITKDMQVQVVRSRTFLFGRPRYRAFCSNESEI